MGALLAFELARVVPVGALLVSGCRAPHLPQRHDPMHELPDAQLVERLASLGGTPAEVLADAELLELALPSLRADLTAAETYAYRPAPPLTCPIRAFAGADDSQAPPSDAEEWRVHTSGAFDLVVLPGGHFFHQDDRFAALVAERLP